LNFNLTGTHAKDGDLAELVGNNHKYFFITLKAGGEFQSHRGVLHHDDLIGRPWGSQVFSHLGSPFYMLQPGLADLIRDTPRNTQILFPKDIGFIMLTLGIGPGVTVVEAGTGSGALTRAMAFAVGSEGRVITYEARPEMQQLAIKNLNRIGLADRVTFKLRDIAEGFDETAADALFLDVPNPHDYVNQVRAALKPGGFFGSILPTTNQVSRLLGALRQADFAFTEVVEIMMRYYRTEPDRLRPTDRMVAHTGYLIFSRPMLVDHSSTTAQDLEEISIPAEDDLPLVDGG
jgi:tRNA (adenine57-N1/adenine58-N1)-methyltransferase